MCKIMAIPGIRPEFRKNLKKWLRAAAPVMTEQDSDGFGYAAIGANGLYGEKWVNPKHAFKFRKTHYSTPLEERFAAALAEISSGAMNYESFGRFQPNDFSTTSSVILHARWATNGSVAVRNTHPFVSKETALIHNGVIQNQRELLNVTSECDSECILNEYADASVNLNPREIKEALDVLKGSFACAVLSKDSQDRYIIDIFRNEGSSLVWAYVAQLGSVVFCTTEGILRETAKHAKFQLGIIHAVMPGKMLRMNAINGDKLGVFPFSAAVKYSAHKWNNWGGAEYDYERDDRDDAERYRQWLEGAKQREESDKLSGRLSDAELEAVYREAEERSHYRPADEGSADSDDFGDDTIAKLIQNHLKRTGTK